ncbi:ER membrane protein complex subunit 8/9 homolog [Contarinia nasturtii]|uniref:ER membrane protein complex subunit 8/9 homolog n=1 Tax=Contarinia nasturtii TaxID=265458 RepID=UPI0012D4ABA4|nr:ER membrane protein complex subunit 8/9 homolog [Contarinia nasturtii]
MTNYKISSRAYSKMVLHAAKYPHCAINGLLLASSKDTSNNIEIVDVMPLFHQNLHLSPMAEIALVQTEALAAANDLQIAGYYAACELFQDNTIEKAPGVKIADKVAENNPNAAFIILNNTILGGKDNGPSLNVYQNKENHWVSTSFTLNQINETLDAVELLIQRGAMKDLYDFDNHLDNIKNDFSNAHLNRDLQQLLAMY